MCALAHLVSDKSNGRERIFLQLLNLVTLVFTIVQGALPLEFGGGERSPAFLLGGQAFLTGPWIHLHRRASTGCMPY